MGPLLRRSEFCAVVAEVSLHNAEYVWSEMPYWLGLDFRTYFMEKHGIEWEYAGAARRSPLQRVI